MFLNLFILKSFYFVVTILYLQATVYSKVINDKCSNFTGLELNDL